MEIGFTAGVTVVLVVAIVATATVALEALRLRREDVKRDFRK